MYFINIYFRKLILFSPIKRFHKMNEEDTYVISPTYLYKMYLCNNIYKNIIFLR